MANIIKKLKRKHKRKKMQSQRAKLEQEQRAIQQMSPEEAYQNRLRRHKHDALRRTVMSIVAVAAIATVVLLYVERRSYHNYRILSASEQEDVVSTKYLEMSGKYSGTVRMEHRWSIAVWILTGAFFTKCRIRWLM